MEEKAYLKSHTPTDILNSEWRSLQDYLARSKSQAHLGFFPGADGIERHSVRVGRCWTHDSALLYVTIDAGIK